MRIQNEILDEEVFITLEPRAGRHVRRDDPLLIDEEPPDLALLGTRARTGGRGLGALVHAARPHLGPTLQALERRHLRPQLGNRLLQGGILRQQPLGQDLQLAARQA